MQDTPLTALAPPVPAVDLAAEKALLGAEIHAAVRDVLDSGSFILGPTVEAFEKEAAAALGAAHAVSLNSGTDAIVLALRALGVGPGDEVITTSYSFFATAEAIALVGAKPIFVDVHPETFDLVVSQVEARITERTKAVIPVHLYGQSADMTALKALAGARGLFVVEDAAQAIGAKWEGRCAGTIGEFGTFSFYPSKNIGAYGDGGMVVTNDATLAEHARKLRNHGPAGGGVHDTIGYNSRLDAVQAAILRVKLPRMDAWSTARRAAAAIYDGLLADEERLVLPVTRPAAEHVYHQYVVRVRGGRPADLVDRINAAGVGVRVYYGKPLSEMPCFEDRPATPDALRASQEVLALPIGPFLRPEQQQRVVQVVRAALATT
ncbi:MAG: DegT/DnrJ/EryC1/StrS family aminotransferase [bacterium]|nr:DegT/DnrJ/EryC1/StrS family aminotransferase [bacterium]